MKVLSLFSGIGAFEKALDNIGIPYELVAFCEIDKYASKSYAAIHGVPESMNIGDITKVDEKKLPKDIDLITYGFPCQDISLAGRQKGLFNADGTQTRSGLFFEALRIIEETQPRVAIAENVKNLTSKKFALQFKIVLDSLYAAGYNNYWKVLNAKDYGIPQNRERVFIVSIRKDIDNGCFKFPEAFPLELRLKDMLEDAVDEKFYLSNGEIKYMHRDSLGNYSNRWTYANHSSAEKSVCLTANIHRGVPYNVLIEDEPSVIQIGNCCPTKTRDNPNQGRIYDTGGLSPALNCMGGGNRQPFVKTDMVAEPNNLRIRKLTPKECFRLMGFEDSDFEKAAAVNSNTQLYKQAGNSIVVPVVQGIIRGLLDCGALEGVN